MFALNWVLCNVYVGNYDGIISTLFLPFPVFNWPYQF
jgi:hypothetical protein